MFKIQSVFSESNSFIFFLVSLVIGIIIQLFSQQKNKAKLEIEVDHRSKPKILVKKTNQEIPKKNILKIEAIKLNTSYITIFGEALLIKSDMNKSDQTPFLYSYGAYTNEVLDYENLKISNFCLLFPNNYRIPIFDVNGFAKIPGNFNPKKINSSQFWNEELNENIYELESIELKIDKLNEESYKATNLPKRPYNSETLENVKKVILKISNYFNDIQDHELIKLISYSTETQSPKNQMFMGEIDPSLNFKGDIYSQLNFSSPLTKYRDKFLIFFHKNDTIEYFVFHAFCKNNATKIIELSNLGEDKISKNYLAIFERLPDELILFLKNYLISEEVFTLSSPYYFDKSKPVNQNLYFKTPFLNIINDKGSKSGTFLDCLGFSFKGKGLRDYVLDSNLKLSQICGYYPNPVQLSKIKSEPYVSLDKELAISNEDLCVFLLIDNINPFFLKHIINGYIEGEFSYKLLNKIYNKYLAIGLEDNAITIPKKWINEFKLYMLIRRKFPDTIFQYKSEWLGNQSLDIFIPSIQIAFEYQGIQHFQPIEFFGGEEALLKRRILDKSKVRKCKSNKILLLFWNYDEEVNELNLTKKLNGVS
jgi:hypothetical protein